MTRRVLLSCVSLAALLSVAPAFGAEDVELKGITIRPDGRICEIKARQRIQAIMQKMIDAAEKRAPGQLSDTEKDAFLTEGWNDTRDILAQYYDFAD